MKYRRKTKTDISLSTPSPHHHPHSQKATVPKLGQLHPNCKDMDTADSNNIHLPSANGIFYSIS